MDTSGERSEAGDTVLPLVICVVLLVLALGFGGWAYANMLQYKNNTDSIVANAVAKAKQDEDTVKAAAYAEQEKSPLRTYAGPTAYGSVTIKYPKTWSGYVIDNSNGSPYIDGYFYPGTVPNILSQTSSFALRVKLIQDSYSDVLDSFSSSVKRGDAKLVPYAAPKVSKVVGARIDGNIGNRKQGSMVVLPLRNMTLELWTEAPERFQSDFDNNILPNFSFLP